MTETFETGYEPRFDFARRSAPPRLAYMIATIPRTGSTYLSHLLWQTGCLGAPLEYLNFDEGGHYGHLSDAPGKRMAHWKSVLRARTSSNGVFGFKCFIMNLKLLMKENSELLSMVRPSRILFLARRDRHAHAVSYARALQSGVWCAEQESQFGGRLEYSQEEVERADCWIDAQTQAWETLFDEAKLKPLRLWYEDVVADPTAAVSEVSRHLGVTLDPKAAVRVPLVLKQSNSESRAWAERYSVSRAARRALVDIDASFAGARA
jgi:trehalose 2-sulfotransferase